MVFWGESTCIDSWLGEVRNMLGSDFYTQSSDHISLLGLVRSLVSG